MTIQEAIVAGLKKKRMTQIELAEKTGISKQRINRMVKGNREPGGAALIEIVKVLEIQKELGLLVENEQSDLEKQVQVLQTAVLELQDKVRKIENKR